MKIRHLIIIAATLSFVIANVEAKKTKVPCDPLTGDATAPGAKALNPFKNRSTPPTSRQIDRRISLAAMLKPGDDTNRFPMTKAATITGFVVSAKIGGIETCNCHATDPVNRDTHIDVVTDARFAVPKLIKVTTKGKNGKKRTVNKDSNQKFHVIVEVTPRVRKQMKAKGVDWSTATLAKTLPGHRVSFTGWLLFDTEHKDEAENTNPGRKLNWRATCNEIHPVTAISILK